MGGREVNITGFNVGEDRLVFVDVPAGTLTTGNFKIFPGVSLGENSIDFVVVT